MLKKVDRALHGPGWVEVIFGAVLSVILGVALGALLLIVRPVVNVKQLPKEEERSAKAVYYIEGTKDVTKGREAPAKRKAFVDGQTITVTEDHLNALVSANVPAKGPTPPPAAKAPEKAKSAEKTKAGEKAAASAPADDEMMVYGTPNFRINDGALQMAVPITFNLLGLSRQVIAQTRGGFVKKGDVFVFEPAEITVGSCPVLRLPYAGDYAREKILNLPVPDDIKTAWSKLANVSIEGKTLKLTVP